MTKEDAIVFGFIAATVVPVLAASVLNVISGDMGVLVSLGLIPGSLFITALITLVFGVPGFLLLTYINLIRWWTTIGVGIVTGVMVALIFRLPNSIHYNDLKLTVPLGFLAGLSFWSVWKSGK